MSKEAAVSTISAPWLYIFHSALQGLWGFLRAVRRSLHADPSRYTSDHMSGNESCLKHPAAIKHGATYIVLCHACNCFMQHLLKEKSVFYNNINNWMQTTEWQVWLRPQGVDFWERQLQRVEVGEQMAKQWTGPPMRIHAQQEIQLWNGSLGKLQLIWVWWRTQELITSNRDLTAISNRISQKPDVPHNKCNSTFFTPTGDFKRTPYHIIESTESPILYTRVIVLCQCISDINTSSDNIFVALNRTMWFKQMCCYLKVLPKTQSNEGLHYLYMTYYLSV